MIEKFSLNNMEKGWFIGNFSPTLLATNQVEVAVKKYQTGDYEASHYHKIATEFTVIIEGLVQMNGVQYTKGDILKIKPGVATDFKVLAPTTTVVVKLPGANNDKFLV
jgi:anti-sigma factor ChrR (cupin superfamily)